MSDHCCSVETPEGHEGSALKKVLWVVFGINLTMFLIEIVSGYTYESSALMADSLDMLSDAFVYGVSILVIKKSGLVKARVALVKGFVMTIMALYVAYELLLRILHPAVSDGQVITVVGLLALTANAVCFRLLSRHRTDDINVRSAWICSRNDMTANVGVILAGGLILYTGQNWPDYMIGGLIALFVLISSFKVITSSMREMELAKKL